MFTRSAKLLLLAVFFAMAGIASADTLTTNHVTALHHQVTQTSARLLKQPASKITLKDLKTLVILAQKYFSTRKEIEEPLFRQRLEDQRNFGYHDDASLQESNLPSVEQTLIAVFQHYLSFHGRDAVATNSVATNSVATLTQLRNLLRQLQAMNQGHLSGGTWLYNSPLPAFAAQHLQPLDQRIIKTSLASATARRKKHQYASAIKTYKTLLADYANTSHAAPLKVLLDAAIVEDYNYQAKGALAKHDYKKGRVALKKIIALYPESNYANAAQKA